MTATAAPAALTVADWHKSAEYLALTSKQRQWVDTFIDTQDAGKATVKAYGGRTTEAYRAMLTKKIQSSPSVLAALDVFYQRSDREKFIRDLQSAVANSDGIARIHALRLYGKATGFLPTDKSAETEYSVNVGDIVLVNGAKFRVTAVDASGKPTDGEPL